MLWQVLVTLMLMGSMTWQLEHRTRMKDLERFTFTIQTFGFAITGGDFDGNKYSDVVVGGFESAAVAYIPARPIAKINSKLNFVSEKINLWHATISASA